MEYCEMSTFKIWSAKNGRKTETKWLVAEI